MLTRLVSGTMRSWLTPRRERRIPCSREETKRLDGDGAEAYANEHLTPGGRGRNDYEMYQCSPTASSSIVDFPLGHWAPDQRGRVRLRREPFDEAALPIGALGLAA
jgi:hypothetical protein